MSKAAKKKTMTEETEQTEVPATEPASADAAPDAPKPKINKGVIRELDFILTETEFADKAKRIAELRLTLDKAKLVFDSAKAEFKSVETEVDEEISEIVHVVRAKKEKRSVEVDEVHDYNTGKVVYIDPKSGDELGQRDLRLDERQLPLFPESKPAKEAECEACKGTGYFDEVTCRSCDGEGTPPVAANDVTEAMDVSSPLPNNEQNQSVQS